MTMILSNLLRAALLGVALTASLSAVARAGSYTLKVEEAVLPVNGRQVTKMTINGGVPGPVLRWHEGEDVTITVVNTAREPTSVHWHGILLPGGMDGAPGFNGFRGIKPGASYTYTFQVRQSGTYWYHSHTGTQDQTVLGAIVIEPREPSPYRADREHTLLLGDATHEDAGQVLRNLKADPAYYNHSRRTLGDFVRDGRAAGFGPALKDRLAWGSMRMDPTDLADVSGYSFLVNGRDPSQADTLLFRKGERVRLRIINGAAMTFFDVRIPGLRMTVIAADGNDVQPVPVDEFRIGIAERYDVIVEPLEDKAFTFVAEPIDRSGFALATLAPSPGMKGPIPAQRKRALLNMGDMGAAHEGMSHEGMDHGGMDHGGMDHAGMDHGGAADGWASGFPASSRVLRYEDLKALRRNVDVSEPLRTIDVRLTGNMERYLWTLNGRRYDMSEPIRVRQGERVRLRFVNETMMAHPMHLHGMFFELENGQSDRKPVKDTVIVPPGQSVSVVLTTTEAGAWPLHCHLLYHMASGMMTTFDVVTPGASAATITPDGAAVPMAVSAGGDHMRHGHGEHGKP